MLSSPNSRVKWVYKLRCVVALVVVYLGPFQAFATPANKAALERHYDRFLSRKLARCTTCHLPSEVTAPKELVDFPHNSFGDRLHQLGQESRAKGKGFDLSERLTRIALEDSDGDGVNNGTELLLGHNPGSKEDVPTAVEMQNALDRKAAFDQFLGGYRWQPFESVHRPALPVVSGVRGTDSIFVGKNPIDAFVSAEWASRGLTPRPTASREVLLRRVYQDLIGLNPSPEEQTTFLADDSADSWEKVVDRLLDDPRYGERWARHWMDVWRYSDWAGWADGNQIRDSKPHIWRWRDWIVESLNADRPYDQMLTEMLAADELTPNDPLALRATGFLVRNYKMLSREQWLEDTVKHTSQAFLGLTVGCAKCHDHMYDPISQREYYSLRAVFEPHQVRTDRIPGQIDVAKDGLPRVYDSTNVPTWFFVRGDERTPLTNEVIQPGVPAALGGKLAIGEIELPPLAVRPDEREFVREDLLIASREAVEVARTNIEKTAMATNTTAAKQFEAELQLDLAEKRGRVLDGQIARERLRISPDDNGATNLVLLQRSTAVAEARLKLHQTRVAVGTNLMTASAESRKKLDDAEKSYADAVIDLARPLDARFLPRNTEVFPTRSSGRRLAFAKWLTSPQNPLAARVAVNQIWLRHFGRGLASNPADFGRNGRPPSHPQLLDWMAAELMEPSFGIESKSSRVPTSGASLLGDPPKPWSMKHLHRLIVTSATYRMASTPSDANLAADPDNLYLWRMNSRRLEAESIRDNLLNAAGSLDPMRGGPDIDHQLALTSNRRSLYLRHAAEKQAEFLQIFDGPSVTECYERHPSVMPQQALALANSELALRQARLLSGRLNPEFAINRDHGIEQVFQRVLARKPTSQEVFECRAFLDTPTVPNAGLMDSTNRALDNLALVMLNHNEFVTIR